MDKIYQICVTKNGGIAKCDTTKQIKNASKKVSPYHNSSRGSNEQNLPFAK